MELGLRFELHRILKIHKTILMCIDRYSSDFSYIHSFRTPCIWKHLKFATESIWSNKIIIENFIFIVIYRGYYFIIYLLSGVIQIIIATRWCHDRKSPVKATWSKMTSEASQSVWILFYNIPWNITQDVNIHIMFE